MLYTSFMQNEIFNDRQTAIEKSRLIAKIQFLDKLKPCFKHSSDEYGDDEWIDSHLVEHDDIVKAYEEYLNNREIIHEVKLNKINKTF